LLYQLSHCLLLRHALSMLQRFRFTTSIVYALSLR
jgi:hypothetical protein